MTPPSADDELTNVEDFERALGQMLLSALERDVDPRGSWVYRTDGLGPDLEVMVHELESKDASD
ncbi:hypothetical protein [Halorhabdus salina]|uniref:hypothetical protein n=1 Tax=Halorhabdus salina TaxID=2750670 RepID=UPI0015EF1FE6|nr:hypothetical protein [Halorhabdus salina]